MVIKNQKNQCGFSLLEVVLAGVLLFFVMGLALTAMDSTLKSTEISTVRSELNDKAVSAKLTIFRQLQSARLSDLEFDNSTSNASGSYVDFLVLEVAAGPDDSDLTWSNEQRIGFAHEAAEASGGTSITISGQSYRLGGTGTGTDSDGDGLIDEGILFHRPDTGASVRRILVTEVVPASGNPDMFSIFQDFAGTTDLGVSVQFRLARSTKDAGRQSNTLATTDTDITATQEGFVVVPVSLDVAVRNRTK